VLGLPTKPFAGSMPASPAAVASPPWHETQVSPLSEWMSVANAVTGAESLSSRALWQLEQ